MYYRRTYTRTYYGGRNRRWYGRGRARYGRRYYRRRYW